MNRFRDYFFAGTAFALQQHGGAAVRDLCDEIKNLEHGLAFAHDVFEVVALLERALELDIFFFRAAPADGGPYVGQKFFVVPGFLHEIRRARLHGAHGIFHRAIGGDHDYRQARVVGTNLRKNLHAITAGQGQIEQHEIKGSVGHLRDAVFAADRRLDLEAFHLQQSLQGFADFSLIINDEYGSARRRVAVHCAAGDHRCFRHALPSCSGESPGRRSSRIPDCFRRVSCPHVPG